MRECSAHQADKKQLKKKKQQKVPESSTINPSLISL